MLKKKCFSQNNHRLTCESRLKVLVSLHLYDNFNDFHSNAICYMAIYSNVCFCKGIFAQMLP